MRSFALFCPGFHYLSQDSSQHSVYANLQNVDDVPRSRQEASVSKLKCLSRLALFIIVASSEIQCSWPRFDVPVSRNDFEHASVAILGRIFRASRHRSFFCDRGFSNQIFTSDKGPDKLGHEIDQAFRAYLCTEICICDSIVVASAVRLRTVVRCQAQALGTRDAIWRFLDVIHNLFCCLTS